jgi:hypothetical protein
MSEFSPEISIKASSRNSGRDVAYRVSVYLGDQFPAESMATNTIVIGRDEQLSLMVKAEENILRVDLTSGEKTAPLGRVNMDGQGDQAVVKQLTSALQRLWFRAITEVEVQPDAPGNAQPQARESVDDIAEKAVTATAKAKKKSPIPVKAVVGAVLLAAAAGAVAYGQFRPKPEQSPQAQAVGDPNSIANAIRQQMAASGGTSDTALAGQNIAIGTLRAMGLEPGKANTGCLVGIH